MYRGWIKLYRGLTNNWLWDDGEPFDRRSAWVDLLLLANHRDHNIVQNGKVIEVKRGDVNRSVTQLADRWKWSRGKVLRFTLLLEKENMIQRSSTRDGTTITIVNYTKYQVEQTSNGTTDRTTDGTRGGQPPVQGADIYNNDKEIKRMYNNDLLGPGNKLSPEGKAKWIELRARARNGGTK